jgi:hypothetical protein
VRWLPLTIGTLGSLAACAGLLGIESPSDRAGSEGDGDAAAPDGGEAGDEVGPDVVAADGADAHEAGGADGAAADEGGGSPDSAGDAAVGVPCGDKFCTAPLVCCYKAGTVAEDCTTETACEAEGKSYVVCDGPEDCGGNACCVPPGGPPGGFKVVCSILAECPSSSSATVCRVGTGTCDCMLGPNDCLPVTTCDGHCM